MIDVTFCQQWKQDWKWTGLCLKLRQEHVKKRKTNFPYYKVSSLRYNAVWDNFKTAFVFQGHSAVRSTR